MISWEASIHGVITTEPNAGNLPIENVTVVWQIMNLDGIRKIDCSGCRGSTVTDEGGAFEIVFNENHVSFYDNETIIHPRHHFPVQVFFEKFSPSPSTSSGMIPHKFLCNKGEDDCSGILGIISNDLEYCTFPCIVLLIGLI